MSLVEMLQGVIGFGLDLISILFRLFLFAVVQVIMSFKNRNGILYGVAVFFFPWAIFLLFWIPRKTPKLDARYKNMEEFRGLNPVIASIMSLAAMVAKSDGRVSESEILQVKQFVAQNFRISKEDLDRYRGAFNYGKKHPEEYEQFTRVIRGYYTNRMTLLGLAYLFMGLAQGNKGTIADEVLLRNILYSMGISQMEYMGMKNSYYARQNGGAWGGNWQDAFGSGQRTNYAPPRVNQTKRYTDVLGVSENASTQEIKSAYRKIVKEFHPDKVASKGMPKEYVDYATQKVKEANEAYEYLMKQKES
ncbi:DnaJ domain-containing protein [Clostridia bacterium]|nr:DnaJ domain-containing protein [Clostridia bacterium]